MLTKSNVLFCVWSATIVAVLVAAVLRLWNLSGVPASLYWEEAALGYDAYSLLKTGKDHHGNVWPIVAVESFGDWKPAGYVYALIPFIQVFGLEPWVVRLPSALAGIFIVIGVGVMAGRLARVGVLGFKKEWEWVVVPVARLLGVIVAGLSPWALQFSRAGFEANLAAALITWSMILAWWLIDEAAQPQKSKGTVPALKAQHWLAGIISAALLVGSVYTYHSARMVAPLLVIALGVWGGLVLKKTNNFKKWLPIIIASTLAAFILALPIILAIGSKTTTQRFAETSIFSDLSVIEESNYLKEQANNVWWSKLLYHRYVLFGQRVLSNYLLHWSPQYLFVSGDSNPRHSTQFIGTLYYMDAAVLLGTVWLLFNRKGEGKAGWWFLAFWVVIGVLPASITFAAPHSLRTLLMMPALLALLAAGGTLLALQILNWLYFELKTIGGFKLTPWMKIALCFVFVGVIEGAYVGQFIRHWRHYTSVYPTQSAMEWQYGYKEMIQLVEAYKTEHPDAAVFITRSAGRPAMYYWFFTKADPTTVQAWDATAAQDQGEYLVYENITLFRALGEINKPGLAVMLSDEWQQMQEEGKLQAQIVAQTEPLRAGQPYWVVAEVK